MELTGSSLLVVADGRHARLFEERRRGGPLIDISDRLGDLSLHRSFASGFQGRVHDRRGPASHTTGGPDPAERREEAFLDQVADQVARVARAGDYQDLVLMAPPKALGRLRRSISRSGLEARHAEAHDRVSQDAEALRASLRALRLRA